MDNAKLSKDYTQAQIKAGLNLLRRMKQRSEDAYKIKTSDFLKGRINGLTSAIESLECLGISPEVNVEPTEPDVILIGSADDWKPKHPGHFA